MKRILKKAGIILAAAALGITAVIPGIMSVSAEETSTATLIISYFDGEGTQAKYLSGAKFEVSLVAKNNGGKFTFIEDAQIPEIQNITQEDLADSSKISEIAGALSEIPFKNTISVETGSSGSCKLAGIEEGVYLVRQTGATKNSIADDYKISPPFLVDVPDRTSDPFEFEVKVYPKATKKNSKYMQVAGVKSWKGDVLQSSNDKDKNEVVRPKSITLHLFLDDKEISQITTTADKDWKYNFGEVNVLRQNGEEGVLSIKEDAVKGYRFSQTEPVTDNYSRTVTINILNTADSTPDTSADMSNYAIWIAIILLCIAGIGVVCIKGKEKNKSEDKKEE